MLKVGITGGIGSGKTIVCSMFRLLGIPVYNADQSARRLMENDEELTAAIRQLFGEEAYLPGGQLNSAYIAGIVFKDQEKLEQLNALVHPVTIRDAESWAQQQTAPYTLKEAALMFESAAFHHVDKVILVHAPVPLRIQRVMKRDHTSRQEVRKRMSRQLDESITLRLADHIIYNDEQQMIIPQVLALHDILLKDAGVS